MPTRSPLGLPVALALILGACGEAPARRVCVVPAPREATYRHQAELSRVAAGRIREEIVERGFAALLPDAAGFPESCEVTEASTADADLVAYVWVQQVDLPREPASEERPRIWGGLELRDADGRELARSVHVLVDQDRPGEPSSDLYVVGEPTDPTVTAEAEAFGAWLLGDPGRFAQQLDEHP
jgi:hypothetical protein